MYGRGNRVCRTRVYLKVQEYVYSDIVAVGSTSSNLFFCGARLKVILQYKNIVSTYMNLQFAAHSCYESPHSR